MLLGAALTLIWRTRRTVALATLVWRARSLIAAAFIGRPRLRRSMWGPLVRSAGLGSGRVSPAAAAMLRHTDTGQRGQAQKQNREDTTSRLPGGFSRDRRAVSSLSPKGIEPEATPGAAVL